VVLLGPCSGATRNQAGTTHVDAFSGRHADAGSIPAASTKRTSSEPSGQRTAFAKRPFAVPVEVAFPARSNDPTPERSTHGLHRLRSLPVSGALQPVSRNRTNGVGVRLLAGRYAVARVAGKESLADIGVLHAEYRDGRCNRRPARTQLRGLPAPARQLLCNDRPDRGGHGHAPASTKAATCVAAFLFEAPLRHTHRGDRDERRLCRAEHQARNPGVGGSKPLEGGT